MPWVRGLSEAMRLLGMSGGCESWGPCMKSFMGAPPPELLWVKSKFPWPW